MPYDDLAERLERLLRGRAPTVQAEWQAQPAAVLVPLYHQGAWHVLFTLRTDSVDVHRGQVSFPGGRLEQDDAGPEQAALREASEEIGIHPEDVRLLGRLDPLLTVTRFLVTPVVGVMPWPYPLRLNSHEVAQAFGVPLEWLSESDNLQVHQREPIEGPPIPVYSFRPYHGHVIWGATARITLNLLEVLGLR
ncbi:MAG: CoA pyrophosphatase [Chloroflexota bacterium]